MKFKKSIATLLSTMLLTGLFATSAFAVTKPFKETENNDTQAQADKADYQYPYFDNMRVFGTFGGNDTVDWYRVMPTDPDAGNVLPTAVRFAGAPDCSYKLEIFDDKLIAVGSLTASGTTPAYLNDFLLKYKVPYYFKVTLLSGTPTQPYDFEIYPY